MITARRFGDDRYWMQIGPSRRTWPRPARSGTRRRIHKHGMRIPATYAAAVAAIVAHDHGCRGYDLILHQEGPRGERSWCIGGERDDGSQGRELFYGWPQIWEHLGRLDVRFECYTFRTWCERCDLPKSSDDDRPVCECAENVDAP